LLRPQRRIHVAADAQQRFDRLLQVTRQLLLQGSTFSKSQIGFQPVWLFCLQLPEKNSIEASA
jgi:hypothetical protein